MMFFMFVNLFQFLDFCLSKSLRNKLFFTNVPYTDAYTIKRCLYAFKRLIGIRSFKFIIKQSIKFRLYDLLFNVFQKLTLNGG